jgi:hypothetical protein
MSRTVHLVPISGHDETRPSTPFTSEYVSNGNCQSIRCVQIISSNLSVHTAQFSTPAWINLNSGLLDLG